MILKKSPQGFPATLVFADLHTCFYRVPRPMDQLDMVLLQPKNVQNH